MKVFIRRNLFSMINQRARKEAELLLKDMVIGEPRPTGRAMIRHRAAAAGIKTKLGNHSFRATGITAYLKKWRNAGKGGGNGEPCVDGHGAALRLPV